MDNIQEREEFIAGLRELADFYESATEFPLPTFATQANVWIHKDQKREMGRLSKLMGRKVEKVGISSIFTLRRRFGSMLTLDVNADREAVCTRKVIGTRQVEERVIEAHAEEIVEWECPPSLLKAARA